MGIYPPTTLSPTLTTFQQYLPATVSSCGSNVSAQHEFHSIGEEVKVSFASNAENNGRGFKLEYSLDSKIRGTLLNRAFPFKNIFSLQPAIARTRVSTAGS
jgi:hypothetical protein